MNLENILRVLRVYWFLMLTGAFIGAASGFGWATLQPKIYTSTASALITAGVSTDLGSALVGDNYAKSRVKSYQDIATSRLVAEYAISQLDIKNSPEALINNVTVTNPPDTALLRVTAHATTPELARDIAEAWIAGMGNAVNVIESSTPASFNGSSDGNSDSPSESIVQLKTLDSAVKPSQPSSPNFIFAISIGSLLGFLLALLFSFVRFNLDKRVRSDVELRKQFGHPILGVLPDSRSSTTLTTSPKRSKQSARSLSEQRSFVEALKKLRSNLQFMNVDDPPRVIVMTSSLPGEGKSTITKNLASALAEAGQTVIAIDGDLRKPTLSKTFGLPEGAGLTDVLVGKVTVNEVLQQAGTTGRLRVLGSGQIPPNPSELLGSQTMLRMLRELAVHSIILIDAPPLLPVTDAAVLAAHTDGAILVVRAGKSTTDQVEQALQNLEQVSGKTLGMILNRVSITGTSGSYYGYQHTGKYVSEHHQVPEGPRRRSAEDQRLVQ